MGRQAPARRCQPWMVVALLVLVPQGARAWGAEQLCAFPGSPLCAFESTPEEIEEARGLIPERWRQQLYLRHAVWLDGELVCTGTAAATEHGLLLYGGATKVNARGRGAYRALIRARWDDAVALGTPALITQGGSMSRPIVFPLGAAFARRRAK